MSEANRLAALIYQEANGMLDEGQSDFLAFGLIAAGVTLDPQPDTASHTDDPATHDPRCISVSRWHVGECYLPQPDTASRELREAIMAEHRECGKPKYDGCYSHWPTPHCRADGMSLPCDVMRLAALAATEGEARDE